MNEARTVTLIVVLAMGLIAGDVSGQAVESRWVVAARGWLEQVRAGEYAAAVERVAPGQARAAFTLDALRGTGRSGTWRGVWRRAAWRFCGTTRGRRCMARACRRTSGWTRR